MARTARDRILLESGTNEVEILEFKIGDQPFGINVAKVMQLMVFEPDSCSPVPDAPPAVRGVIMWRGQNLALIDLHTALNRGTGDDILGPRPIVLVTEFNRVRSAFIVTDVARIHRVGWDSITPMTQLLATSNSQITGTLNLDDHDVLLVDFESVLSVYSEEIQLDHHAETLQSEGELAATKGGRDAKRIWMAEDSDLIRHSITKILKNVGYRHLRAFENGEDCWNALREAADTGRLNEEIDMLITDIEMPRLDGLTLCRRVKEDNVMRRLPVVVFSSLASDQMADKARGVGADGLISKPQIGTLVDLVDSLLITNQQQHTAAHGG